MLPLFSLGFESGGAETVIVVSIRRRRVGRMPDVVILWGSSLQRATATLTAWKLLREARDMN
jgi:hypothetical protein